MEEPAAAESVIIRHSFLCAPATQIHSCALCSRSATEKLVSIDWDLPKFNFFFFFFNEGNLASNTIFTAAKSKDLGMCVQRAFTEGRSAGTILLQSSSSLCPPCEWDQPIWKGEKKQHSLDDHTCPCLVFHHGERKASYLDAFSSSNMEILWHFYEYSPFLLSSALTNTCRTRWTSRA